MKEVNFNMNNWVILRLKYLMKPGPILYNGNKMDL